MYQLTSRADEDLTRILRYGIEQFGSIQAERYFDGLIEHLEEVAANPERWPRVDHLREGYRRSVYRRHSIYYKPGLAQVLIVRILRQEDAERQL